MRHAVCLLRGDGIPDASILIDECPHGLRITGTVAGLSPGLHGFHVHEFGDLRDGCQSMCAHFNPTGSTHGGLRSAHRHLGDLGNISANQNGTATIDIIDPHLRLTGPFGIIGRGLIIHADRDDLGRGPAPDSLITGNSGKRIMCGVIGWASH